MTSAGILSNWYFGTPFIIDLVFAVFLLVSYFHSRFAGGFKVVSVLTVGVLVFCLYPLHVVIQRRQSERNPFLFYNIHRRYLHHTAGAYTPYYARVHDADGSASYNT